MARLVRHDRQGPYPVTVGGQTVYICGCGLSSNKPFCDGSHKKTLDEQPNEVFVYSPEGRLKISPYY